MVFITYSRLFAVRGNKPKGVSGGVGEIFAVAGFRNHGAAYSVELGAGGRFFSFELDFEILQTSVAGVCYDIKDFLKFGGDFRTIKSHPSDVSERGFVGVEAGPEVN